MQGLKITAAVPCYNAEKYIDRCIESLLNQTVKPIEIIVINDGSTDLSEKKIKRFKQVKLLNHKGNLGLAEARNTAIKNSSGDIIVFIDSDAKAHPYFIENILNCYTDENVVGVGGEAIEGIITIFDSWRHYHAYQGQKEKVTKKVDMIAGVASSYRRNIFEKIGFFNPEFKTNSEDMEFGLRLKKEGFSLIYNPDALVDHMRVDNFSSLTRMIFNWYYYGFIARKKVYGEAAFWYIYVITKHAARNVFQDIFIHKSVRLVLISIWMTLVEYFSVLKNLFLSR